MSDPLARYELGELLGTGATSEVFVAKDKKLRRDVAVKRLLQGVADDPAVRTCFHREAQALARVRHKNVVAVHDYSGTDSQVLFLVMDLVRGKSLDQWVEKVQAGDKSDAPAGSLLQAAQQARPRVDENILWAIMHELSGALEACHAQNVIHRDLKPENVILTSAGRLLLVDFGVARSFEAGDGVVAQSAGTQVMGTPDFMSPEQVTSTQLSGASDIFSLGAVLYYLATGARPFHADGVLATLKKIMAVDFVPPKQARPQLSQEFASLLERMLQKAPAARPSAAESAALARVHLTRANVKAETLLAEWVTGRVQSTQKMREVELSLLFERLGKALQAGDRVEIKRVRKRILEIDPDNETVFEMQRASLQRPDDELRESAAKAPEKALRGDSQASSAKQAPVTVASVRLPAAPVWPKLLATAALSFVAGVGVAYVVLRR